MSLQLQMTFLTGHFIINYMKKEKMLDRSCVK